MSEQAVRHMLHALDLAARGWGQTAPNPMVGAVLVRDGEVVGEGWHELYGGPHAEVNAIRAAGTRASGARLFVTLEPCAHKGKTPPCVDALLRVGIPEVTIATLDPTPAGGGADILRKAGVVVDVGCEGRAARELNAPFFFAAVADRPWVTLKLALSAEGAIAGPRSGDGTRPQTWLTGDDARCEVHRLRAGADAVAVGIGTVLSDDPQLTVRHFEPPRVPPIRVVFDRRARTPLSSNLVRTARSVPTLVVTREKTERTDALSAHGVEVLLADDLPTALRLLRLRGIRSILVEGGAGVAGALLNGQLVDRVVHIESAVSLGTGSLGAFDTVDSPDLVRQSLELREARQLGNDVMKLYAVRGHDV